MTVPYSVRLGVGQRTSNGGVSLGTVPSGKRWIIRDIVFSQLGTGSGRARLINTSLGGYIAVTPVLAQFDTYNGITRHWVANTGETFQLVAFSSTAPTDIWCHIYGYELSA